MGKRSPLYDWHAKNEGRFMDVAGWEVPEMYGKRPDPEYAALRNGAGMLDLCHEARYRIEGEHSAALLNELLTVDVESLQPGKSIPGFLCNDKGGIIDAVTVYRDPNYFLLLGSCAARAQAVTWMEDRAKARLNLKVSVVDVTQAQGQIGLRGPGALPLLERVSFGQQFAFTETHALLATIGTARCLVIKRFHGEGGMDLIAGSIYIQSIWEKLAEAARAMGAKPIGHVAREIVRIESGWPALGVEIDETTTPIEVNLDQRIDFRKKKFIGRRALMHSTSSEFSRQLVLMRTDSQAPIEPGGEVLFDGLPIGYITSSCVSPAMRAAVALGFINTLKSGLGTRVAIRKPDGQMLGAEVAKPLMAPVR